MKTLTVSLLFFLYLPALTAAIDSSPPVTLSIGTDVLEFANKKFGQRLEVLEKSADITLVNLDEAAIPWLSMLVHQEFGRCGGFMRHDSEEEGFQLLDSKELREAGQKARFLDYEINREDIVRSMMSEAQAQPIANFIRLLSNFHNRYYDSESGVASTNAIADHWRELTKFRTDVSVELYRHSAWLQPTVIMTIQGQTDERIIVGGHADSIAGTFSRARARAPGADDNASGIATMTEVIRVIVESGYRPYRTIQFMGYAAEEVGLRGSKEIAQNYRNQGIDVVGVLQLDMTNYPGADKDIVLMNDFTSAPQNAFIGQLIGHYLPELRWGYDRCGYACSDHASWTQAGFPASIPFESTNRQRNPHIHTDRDTLERSSVDASHAVKFAKLALAFVVEIDEPVLP